MPYGRVGVGLKGDLEAAIHSMRSFIDATSVREDICCLKIDMTNAFNCCCRSAFLERLPRNLPKLFAWAQWSYHSPGELQFGNHRILSTAGAQQGDPLSPLLFSLVILELLDSLDSYSGLHFQLWYLDDGSFVGNRESIPSLLQSLLAKGPIFGLHINLDKCELYWPSGDQTFPEFPSEVRRLSEGIELLGSPVQGSVELCKFFTAKRVDKILESSANLGNLDDPQVEFLPSCQSVCKVSHFTNVVSAMMLEQIDRFDQGLRRSLEIICRSSVTDMARLQATLPIRLGGLGLREAVQFSPAAYVGSCNSTRKMVQVFLKRLAIHWILQIYISRGFYYQETLKFIFRFVTI